MGLRLNYLLDDDFIHCHSLSADNELSGDERIPTADSIIAVIAAFESYRLQVFKYRGSAYISSLEINDAPACGDGGIGV